MVSRGEGFGSRFEGFDRRSEEVKRSGMESERVCTRVVNSQHVFRRVTFLFASYFFNGRTQMVARFEFDIVGFGSEEGRLRF